MAKMLPLNVNINFSYWILASVSALSFFGLGLAGMSDFSALAQGTAEGTIVSMAKGSQSADNPEFTYLQRLL
jgi:hypothetical protein